MALTVDYILLCFRLFSFYNITLNIAEKSFYINILKCLSGS